jgi:uncharacterized membrane protein YhhN
MKEIFLVILAVLSVVYLISLLFKRGLFQAVLKACLVPLVLAIYISSANQIFFLVVLGLALGWAGDILLLKIEKELFFKLGLASFLLGHICYIISMLHFTGTLNVTVLIISLIIAAVAGVLVFFLIRPTREMKTLVIIYETVILCMAVSAVQFFTIRGFPLGVIAVGGGISFVISDTILAYQTFHGETRFSYFFVMLTYIAAQLCIALAFAGI